MRRTINNIISVVHSMVRLGILKLFHFNGVFFSLLERLSPNVVLEVNKNAKLYLGKKVRIHSGSKLKVRPCANLTIEDNVELNYNNIIVCRNNISIGQGTAFGPSVCIYDHDHDYKAGLQNNEYIVGNIKIGKNCWIGANTIILKDTEIGDNCVVAAGSVIKGKYKNNSLIYQKRCTDIKEIVLGKEG